MIYEGYGIEKANRRLRCLLSCLIEVAAEKNIFRLRKGELPRSGEYQSVSVMRIAE